ncbi:hypothetical protein UP10_41615 [Bradyrhizobium sp. LTSPM299]|jgi:hypothetical protein|uniref:hypothetical protein n=1 Tax=Bradyrhizobium sp. LTSPM299 TaxID=1619233 RepID=UPI0005CA17BE|nr:hypothetical protein [Bradyrhizobium sp. LTSPM299]KJC53900.1 hypothetical protein UP10_41615 [Bradyrhizobium sp. LTSPM299]
MKKSIKVMPKKRRGRPATGKDPQIVVRMPSILIAGIDAWGVANGIVRSETIRRLIELGLTVKPNGRSPSDSQRSRAREMAAKAIDGIIPKSAPPDEQESRKLRLVKGPEEFREIRKDRSKKKPGG